MEFPKLPKSGYYPKEVFKDVHENFEEWFDVKSNSIDLETLIDFIAREYGLYLDTGWSVEVGKAEMNYIYNACCRRFYDSFSFSYQSESLMNSLKGLLCKILLSADDGSSFEGSRENLLERQKSLIFKVQELQKFENKGSKGALCSPAHPSVLPVSNVERIAQVLRTRYKDSQITSVSEVEHYLRKNCPAIVFQKATLYNAFHRANFEFDKSGKYWKRKTKMELKVKDLMQALSKANPEETVYIEAGFGNADIHVAYNVVKLESGRIVIYGDGHCSEDDRDGTEFDSNLKEESLIYEK